MRVPFFSWLWEKAFPPTCTKEDWCVLEGGHPEECIPWDGATRYLPDRTVDEGWRAP